MPQAQPDPSDDDLVGRSLLGDTASYGVLVARHQREVRRILCGIIDPGTIENLVQEAFLVGYGRLSSYRLDADFRAWLCGIARNLLRHELRRRSRETRQLRLYRHHLDAVSVADGAADDAQRALVEATKICRGRLAEAAARAITLRYEEARPVEDIAAALGRTPLATRQLLFRARLAIKNCVEEKMALV